MPNRRPATEIIKKLLAPKPLSLLFLSVVAIALSFLFIRGCTSDFMSEPDFKIGQDTRWKDLNILGKQRNLVAFNNDFIAQIAKLQKIHLQIVPTFNYDLFSDLEQGKLQGFLALVKLEELDEKKFLASNPYFLTGPVLILPLLKSLEEFQNSKRRVIGIDAKSSVLAQFENDSNNQLRFYSEILEALSDLSISNLDAAVFPSIQAHTYVKTFYANELKVATAPLNQNGLRLVALNNKQGKELIAHFNAGIEELDQNGTFADLLSRWSLINAQQFTP